MKNTTKLFIALILSFIVVLFSVINAQQIEVNFAVTKVSLPLAIVLIGAIFFGALIVFIVMASNIWQKNKTIKQLKLHLQEAKTDGDSESNEIIEELKRELKEKELELSDVRHNLVNDMMSEKTFEMNDWSENLDEDK